jgi:probable addiction module antidote protein
MVKGFSKYDVAEYLDSDEMIVAYLAEVSKENDPKMLTMALGDIARAKGMTQLAKETGISRDGLYKSLGENGNPSLETLSKIANALGLKVAIVAK